MKIIITKSFNKILLKYRIDKSVLCSSLIKFINYPSPIELGFYDDFVIGKLYLQGSKKRLITLVENNGYIIPVIIVKKESKKGWNINKNNVIKLFFTDIKKVIKEVELELVVDIFEI